MNKNKENLCIRLKPDIKKMLKSIAKERGISASVIIESLLREKLLKPGKKTFSF